MEFFRSWPLQYYRTLRILKDKGLTKLYYDVDNDRILTEEESDQYTKPPYRRSDTYYIVGKRTTINNAYKSIDVLEVPEVPIEIQRIIDAHKKENKLYQQLVSYDKKTQKSPVKIKGPTTPKNRGDRGEKRSKSPERERERERERPKSIEKERERPKEELKAPFDVSISELADKVQKANQEGKAVKLDTASLVKKNQGTYIYNKSEDIPLAIPKKSDKIPNSDKAVQYLNFYEEKIRKLMGNTGNNNVPERKASETRKLERLEDLTKPRSPSVSISNTAGKRVFGVPTKYKQPVTSQTNLNNTIPVEVEQLKQRLSNERKSPRPSVPDVLTELRHLPRIDVRTLPISQDIPKPIQNKKKAPVKEVITRRRDDEIDVDDDDTIDNLASRFSNLADQPDIFSHLASEKYDPQSLSLHSEDYEDYDNDDSDKVDFDYDDDDDNYEQNQDQVESVPDEVDYKD